MNTYGVVLFHNTSSVLRAEKVLQKAGLATKLVPTPRQFSSDCGLALRFDWADAEQVRRLIQEARVEISGFHPL